ncbi:MAG: hypothetical protein JSV20_05370 [Candidatus Bathyarchaeota archaeon]|nr:MAG: hypothetical protein JSV20_05370 [Candidatus Bathyarchaeota archaeon]
MVEQSLKDIIKDTIEEYNRYHSPEVVIKLVSIYDRAFKLEFSGSFCQTCGFYDYFDDYQILLEDTKLKTKITEIVETNEGAIVNFQIL